MTKALVPESTTANFEEVNFLSLTCIASIFIYQYALLWQGRNVILEISVA